MKVHELCSLFTRLSDAGYDEAEVLVSIDDIAVENLSCTVEIEKIAKTCSDKEGNTWEIGMDDETDAAVHFEIVVKGA